MLIGRGSEAVTQSAQAVATPRRHEPDLRARATVRQSFVPDLHRQALAPLPFSLHTFVFVSREQISDSFICC
ncbi:hypothetical protein PHSY_005719 [Pseudozyma hubeiensis SY62]|uniref:Uncharacterized protein n=1 Tax=Pseudozyma hubeiensis (strain SY62) TaxID=1305764 RepID=R9PJ25_PSEHS|nr:hypothetical protein PHSY_005719 [Pseudozyma hubeiensis SY62]GAC98130.1 hypothetical protein PHSY_005719 [Pseudozyma hubeiensis SY62]